MQIRGKHRKVSDIKLHEKTFFNMRKKIEDKNVRADKDVVLEMLYALFEKHQYYKLKDLVKITKQPVTYLKEILREVCNYNYNNPHKGTWELKPEYRYYK